MKTDYYIEQAESLVEAETDFGLIAEGEQTKHPIAIEQEELRAQWKKVKTALNALLSSDKVSKDDKAAIKKKYKKTYAAYVRFASTLSARAEKLNATGKHASDSVSLEHSIRLPPCDTEVFKGDYLSWPTFHDMFTAIYIRNSRLSPVEKLFHLNQKTQGEAKDIVKKCPLTNEGFEMSCKNLCERYENKRILVNTQLQILFNLKKVENIYKLVNVSALSVPSCFPNSSAIGNSAFHNPVIDQNSFSPSSHSSIASGNTSTRSKSCESATTPNFQTSHGDRGALVVLADSTENIPPVVLKCNNCDFFAQSKYEMELHLGTNHPQTEPDYISIPTNSVAMQAFQEAVAAATAAASAVTAKGSTKNKTNFQKEAIDNDCPTSIKRERLYSPKNDGADKRGIFSQNTSINAACDTVPTTTIDSSLLRRERKSNRNILEEPELSYENEMQLKSRMELKNLEAKSGSTVHCPLCADTFDLKQSLETHLMNMHCVNRDGLARLLQLVDTCVWQHMLTRPSMDIDNMNDTLDEIKSNASPFANNQIMTTASSTKVDIASGADGPFLTQKQSLEATNSSENLSCEQCSGKFKHEEELLQHVQNMQHFVILPNGDHKCLAATHPSTPCLSLFPTQTALVAHYKSTHISLIISERHVYKYRCKHCSLAFKTQDKLSTHFLYHTMRDATKCTLCQRSFRSTQALQKHVDQYHSTRRTEELTQSSDNNGLESPNLKSSPSQVKSQSSDMVSVVRARW